MLTENELWLLSFYRASEISGSLFFGRLARSMRPGPIQRDMTKHFFDEAAHAWYWSACIESLGSMPLKIKDAYQDEYVAAAGLPANLMEVLAITQIFEQRVIGQYSIHSTVPGLNPRVKETLDRIMQDERWHIEWIRNALREFETEYGAEHIDTTLRRFREADREVFHKLMQEHQQRVQELRG